jgi:hypothetical protein
MKLPVIFRKVHHSLAEGRHAAFFAFVMRIPVIPPWGTLAFGLAATCCVFIWFYLLDTPYNRYNENSGSNEDRRGSDASTPLPKQQGFPQTVVMSVILHSRPLHVLFDWGIYFIQACPRCRATEKNLVDPHNKIWRILLYLRCNSFFC